MLARRLKKEMSLLLGLARQYTGGLHDQLGAKILAGLAMHQAIGNNVLRYISLHADELLARGDMEDLEETKMHVLEACSKATEACREMQVRMGLVKGGDMGTGAAPPLADVRLQMLASVAATAASPNTG